MTHRTDAVARRQMPMTAGYDASRWRYLDRRHAKNENVQDDAEASRRFGSIGRQSWHESSRRSDPACIEQQKVGDEAVIRFRRFCVPPRTRQLLADGRAPNRKRWAAMRVSDSDDFACSLGPASCLPTGSRWNSAAAPSIF